MAGTMGGLPGVKGTGEDKVAPGDRCRTSFLQRVMSLPTCGSLSCPPTFGPAGGRINCHCFLGALIELIITPVVTWASVICPQEWSSLHSVLGHRVILSQFLEG